MAGGRRFLILVCGLAVGGLLLPGSADAAPNWLDSFSKPLKRWKESGKVDARRVRWRGDRALVLARPGKRGGTLRRRLPARRWALSLNLALAPGGRATISLGDRKRRHTVNLLRFSGGGLQVALPRGKPGATAKTKNPSGGNWVHLEARAHARSVTGTIGGIRFKLRGKPERTLYLTLAKRKLRVDDVIATRTDTPSLLLHRLSGLQARVPPGRFLLGADDEDTLYTRTLAWTRGFFAGTLWQAAALAGRSDLFETWALERTLENFGYEGADSHDMGFVYELTSVEAYRRRCAVPPTGVRTPEDAALCQRFLASGLAAANRLMGLAASNEGAGTIPTGATHPRSTPDVSDTLIDSLMNLPLLYWATEQTGDPKYRDVAARHARRVVELLVRADGSTSQSVHMNRQTGEVVKVHTHQGLRANTTWARGQAWAIYGLTSSAAALRDRSLLEAAERTAAYADANLPAGGVPRFDYQAPPEAGDATAAGVITAAGLFRLGELCRQWGPGGCRQPDRWQTLADYMLRRALRRVSRDIPLGFFWRSIDLDTVEDGSDANSERVYGLYYALEAIKLKRSSAQG